MSFSEFLGRFKDIWSTCKLLSDGDGISASVGPSFVGGIESPRSQCSVCPNVCEEELHLLRQHYKSDWHIYNLRRQGKKRSSLSRDEFADRQAALLAALVRMQDEDECEIEDQEFDSSASDSEVEEPVQIGSCFVEFFAGSSHNDVFLVYKRVIFSTNELSSVEACRFLTSQDLLSRLEFANSSIRVIILARSGRIAIGVYDGNGCCVAHKLLKKYTSRKKQGGSQITQDLSTGGRARSAGSFLRRQNEVRLAEEFAELSLEPLWKDYFRRALAIFWTPTTSARFYIFGQEHPGDSLSALKIGDERMRSIPFTTYIPTFAEVERCHTQLFSVHRYLS